MVSGLKPQRYTQVKGNSGPKLMVAASLEAEARILIPPSVREARGVFAMAKV